MRSLDLFTGIGGLGRLLPVTPVLYCEQAEFPRRVLQARMKSGDLHQAPIFDDITKLHSPPDHDIIVAGFPCTDISKLGFKKGFGGQKSSLFYQVLRIVKLKHPKYVFLENVVHILSMPDVWQEIVISLSLEGYDMKWCVFGANNVGAVHRRNRWFLLATFTGVRCSVKSNLPMHMGKFGKILNGVFIPEMDPGAPRTRLKTPYVLKALDGVEFKSKRGKLCTGEFKRSLWATPRACGGNRAVYNMTYRSICDLPSQLRFASTTKPSNRHLCANIAWVENLMGLGGGWTDPNCESLDEFPGFHVEQYERMKKGKQANYYDRWKCLGNMCVSQTSAYAFYYLMNNTLKS